MKRRNDWFQAALHVAVAGMVVGAMAGLATAQVRQPLMCCRTLITTYTLTDLGAGGNGWSFAYAINGAGQAAGEFNTLGGAQDGFRTAAKKQINYYSNDDIGVLPGDFRSYAYAINAAGTVVGTSVHLGGPNHAIRSTAPGAALEDLNTVSGSNTFILTGATGVDARGISDYGWIVGCFSTNANAPGNCDDPWSDSHSFVSFGPGWTEPIDASWYGSPAFSGTVDVNNNDQMVGFMRRHSWDAPTAFFFDAAAGVMRLTTMMLPGGGMSTAYALNDSGQVVGSSQISTGTSYGTHAFLFHDNNSNGIVDAGELIDLDTMNTSYSAALGINGGGTAVGYFGSNVKTSYGNSRAAVFANGMYDLNNLVQGGTGGWTLRAAYGINDGGQIVGYMQSSTGAMHAFRLDPVPVLRLPLLP